MPRVATASLLMRLHSRSEIARNDCAAVADSVGERVRRLEGKRLLLTGASGFLASRMAQSLAWLNDNYLSSRCTLVALVRTAPTPDGPLGTLIGRSDVEFVVQSVNDPLELDRPVDFIVHAASKASPKDYLANPLDTMDANTVATRRLLTMAQDRGVESFLFFSSGEIYGEVPPESVPTPETFPGLASSTAPRACYAESKRFGETLCATFHREFHVPAKIVRPFHVYGPGLSLDDGRVVADFLKNRVECRPIRLLSDGSAVRSFCYVSDATAGFWQTLLSEHDGEAFNIGDDREPVSILELARVVAGLESPKLEVTHETAAGPEYLRGTPSRACPDISKAKRLLGYRPQVRLRQGLLRALWWHQLSEG